MNKTIIEQPHSVSDAFDELLNKMYISNVQNRLRQLNEPSESDSKRWLWELIQNAKDSIVEKIIEREKKIITGGGVTPTIKVRTGDPSDEIIAETREGDYDIIVLGYRGTASFKEFLLGDVVAKVLRDSFSPTLIYRSK